MRLSLTAVYTCHRVLTPLLPMVSMCVLTLEVIWVKCSVVAKPMSCGKTNVKGSRCFLWRWGGGLSHDAQNSEGSMRCLSGNNARQYLSTRWGKNECICSFLEKQSRGRTGFRFRSLFSKKIKSYPVNSYTRNYSHSLPFLSQNAFRSGCCR
jgi:hypothetical protein